MYPPPYHQSQEKANIISLIKHYPLGMLVTSSGDKPYLTHIPIIYNERSGKLIAHIDKNNPQVATLQNGKEATVVFRGPDAYISPSIYTTKQLPTWNYIYAHITGTISLIDDEDEAKETMVSMTKFLEGSEQKYVLEKDNNRMNRLINYIQAFKITITNWEGKFKLSQDKNQQDFENAKQVIISKSRPDEKKFIQVIYKEFD